MRSKLFILSAVAVAFFCVSDTVSGDVILSTNHFTWFGGTWVESGDLLRYDQQTGAVDVTLDASVFGKKDNIDAVHVSANGNYILSTANKATLGGLEFDDGDLVEYNPSTDTAVKIFDEDLFSKNEDIDAVYVTDDGQIVMSTHNSATLFGVSFDGGDLIQYDPLTSNVSVLFDEDLFRCNENIDAVHVLPGGDLVFSTQTNGELFGVSFRDDDLVRYDPISNDVQLYQTTSGCITGLFTDIDAVSFTGGGAVVPEPATLSLAAIGGLVLLTRRLRKA